MRDRERDEWLGELEARQRNIVFPDTTRNEARLFRLLYRWKRPLTLLQWLGVVVLFMFAAGFVIAVAIIIWPSSDAPWWDTALKTYGFYALVITGGAFFIVRGNRRLAARDKKTKPRRHE